MNLLDKSPVNRDPSGDRFVKYREMYTPDPEKLRLLSHSKRFLERWTGDEEFRNSLLQGTATWRDAAATCGCDIDVSSLRPVFHPDFIAFRAEATKETWPLTALWDEFIGTALHSRHDLTLIGYTRGHNVDFDVWRTRQMGRAFYELGLAGAGIIHPPVAVELSTGCSVGCSFCGLTADKFKGHASLSNGGLEAWEEIIDVLMEFFGPALRTGFLYWATDPLDNPEYLGFLDAWEKKVGVLPQTTTAIPLRNVDLTRQVLDRWSRTRGIPNRFSIISTRILRDVHATFTPEELFGVELVLQNKGSMLRKTLAGRPYIKVHDARETKEPRASEKNMSAGTIACVSGFLLNIHEKTVKLVSPTTASDEWPNGYIEFDSASYSDAASLRVVLNDLRTRHMTHRLRPDLPLRLADGIRYTSESGKPRLLGRSAAIENEAFGVVANKLQAGDATPMQLLSSLTTAGENAFKVVGVIEHLWSSGVVEQTNQHDQASLIG